MTADSSVYTSCTKLADSAKWIIDTSKYQAQTHDVINRFMYMCLEILHPIFGTSIMCSSGSFTLSMVLIHDRELWLFIASYEIKHCLCAIISLMLVRLNKFSKSFIIKMICIQN